jgi:hypothetical protein
MRPHSSRLIGISMAMAALLCLGSPARAVDNLSPADIQKIFMTGKPFSAVAPSGKEMMITFDAKGTVTAVPKGKKKGAKGTWRVSEKGYCTTWAKGSEHCYTIRKNGDKYDVVSATGTVMAHWSTP